MIFEELKLKGAFLVTLEPITDERGFFARSFCRQEFSSHGLHTDYPQENISFNKLKGTLRGLHYQASPHQETKLVSCTRGRVYDVVVDIRKTSATYKQWCGVELHAGNYSYLYIPEGFAHGFLTLEDNSEVHYHMGSNFVPEAARCIHWKNPELNIDWPEEPTTLSEKDNTSNDLSWL